MVRETVEQKREALERELKRLREERGDLKKRQFRRVRNGWFGILSGLVMILVSGHLALGVHTAWSNSFFEVWLIIVSGVVLIGSAIAIIWGLVFALSRESCYW